MHALAFDWLVSEFSGGQVPTKARPVDCPTSALETSRGELLIFKRPLCNNSKNNVFNRNRMGSASAAS